MTARQLAVRLSRAVKQCEANSSWTSGLKWKPLLQGSLSELIESGRARNKAKRERAKEVADRNRVQAPLAKAYSVWRRSALAVDPSLQLTDFRAGITGLADFDLNVDALMDHLENEHEKDEQANVPLIERRFEFAAEALAELRPLREAYDKEALEADAAKQSADGVEGGFAAAYARANANLSTYRQLVRAKFGDRSREAAELRNPPKRGAAKEPATPEIDEVLDSDG